MDVGAVRPDVLAFIGWTALCAEQTPAPDVGTAVLRKFLFVGERTVDTLGE